MDDYRDMDEAERKELQDRHDLAIRKNGEQFALIKQLEATYTTLCYELNKQKHEIEKLENEIKLSGGLKCPNCDDVGFTPRQISEDEWEQEQCEFCYTIDNSIFNRNKA